MISLPLLLQDGTTALMRAAENGHLDVAEKLLGSGAQVDATDVVSVSVTS